MEHAKYISLEALAATLALPKRYLKLLASSKMIPSLDVSGRRRFNVAQVRAALDAMAAQHREASRE